MAFDFVISLLPFHAPFPPPQPQGNICDSHDACEQAVDWWVVVVGWVLAPSMGLTCCACVAIVDMQDIPPTMAKLKGGCMRWIGTNANGSMVVGLKFHLPTSVITFKKSICVCWIVGSTCFLLAFATLVDLMTFFCLLLSKDNLELLKAHEMLIGASTRLAQWLQEGME